MTNRSRYYQNMWQVYFYSEQHGASRYILTESWTSADFFSRPEVGRGPRLRHALRLRKLVTRGLDPIRAGNPPVAFSIYLLTDYVDSLLIIVLWAPRERGLVSQNISSMRTMELFPWCQHKTRESRDVRKKFLLVLNFSLSMCIKLYHKLVYRLTSLTKMAYFMHLKAFFYFKFQSHSIFDQNCQQTRCATRNYQSLSTLGVSLLVVVLAHKR